MDKSLDQLYGEWRRKRATRIDAQKVFSAATAQFEKASEARAAAISEETEAWGALESARTKVDVN